MCVCVFISDFPVLLDSLQALALGNLTPTSELLSVLIPTEQIHKELLIVQWFEFLNLMKGQIDAQVNGQIFEPYKFSYKNKNKKEITLSKTQEAMLKIEKDKELKVAELSKKGVNYNNGKDGDGDDGMDNDDGDLMADDDDENKNKNENKPSIVTTHDDGDGDIELDIDPDGDEHEAWEDEAWKPPINQQEYISSPWGEAARQIHIRVVSAAHLPSSSSSSDQVEKAYVEMETYGAPCDKRLFTTSEVGNDGVKFVFDESFTSIIAEPRLALLRFTVYRQSIPVALK